MINRDVVIERLVLDCVEKLHTYRCTQWLQFILEQGFAGYANMTDEQLRKECALRGVSWEDDFTHAPSDEEFDEDEEEDDELRRYAVPVLDRGDYYHGGL